jgi:hypothetical protein
LAENRYLAEDARDRIEIAFEPLEAVIDPETAVRADAPLLHEEARTNVLAMREFARGDVGAEMATAPVRVGRRFRFHRKTPVAIENRACLARGPLSLGQEPRTPVFDLGGDREFADSLPEEAGRSEPVSETGLANNARFRAVYSIVTVA